MPVSTVHGVASSTHSLSPRRLGGWVCMRAVEGYSIQFSAWENTAQPISSPCNAPSLALNLHNTAVGDKARRPSGHFTSSDEEGRLKHEHSHPPVNYSLITYLFLPLVSVRMVKMCIYSSLINLCMQRYYINTHIQFFLLMYYVYKAADIYYLSLMWMEGGPSLDITMSHYCQMQWDLKGPASFIKGGGRRQKENSQATRWEQTDRRSRNIQPSPYGGKAEGIKGNATIRWAMYAATLEPPILLYLTCHHH